MNLIKQNFEILQQEDFTLPGIKKFIERCYKSESEITENSYEKFVDSLVEKNNTYPLEFGTVHLKIEGFDSFNDFIDNLVDQGVYNSELFEYTYYSDTDTEIYYITTDYKYFLQLKECSIAGALITSEDNEYYPKRYTVRFIISRGLMDEFRAYSTKLSYLYREKITEDITFIQPDWFKEERAKHTMELIDPASAIYEYNCLAAEENYLDLIAKGLTPQQARDVLPLGIMSEYIFCGFIDVWDNFFHEINIKDTNSTIRDITNSLKKHYLCHRNFY